MHLQQRMDERFREQVGVHSNTQIRAFANQFANMGGSNDCHRQPNPRHADEKDKYSIKNEPINSFAECIAQM